MGLMGMARKAKKLKELGEKMKGHVIDEINNINVVVLEELADELNEISDPRDEAFVRHKLGDVIVITFFAVMANADEWLKIEVFGVKNETWLRNFLELPYGIPTDDTFRIVISKLNVNYVYELVIGFLKTKLDAILNVLQGSKSEEKEIISCDGKVSKSSKRNETDKSGARALNTLNAYSSDWGMCIGQEFIEEKTNEIPAMPILLNRLNLEGTIVTWDALNTQKETVQAVIQGGGQYVGALKGNQGNLYADVKDYFDEETLTDIRLKDKEREKKQYKKTVEKEHSAVVTREYYIEPQINWLYDREKWAGLTTIGVVVKTTKKIGTDEVIVEARYYICSLTDIDDFERAVREHWGVENGLHWHLDYTFQDDKNTTKKGNGAEGLQIFKKIALAFLKVAQVLYPPRTSLKIIRFILSLDFENEIGKIFTALNVATIKDVFSI